MRPNLAVVRCGLAAETLPESYTATVALFLYAHICSDVIVLLRCFCASLLTPAFLVGAVPWQSQLSAMSHGNASATSRTSAVLWTSEDGEATIGTTITVLSSVRFGKFSSSIGIISRLLHMHLLPMLERTLVELYVPIRDRCWTARKSIGLFMWRCTNRHRKRSFLQMPADLGVQWLPVTSGQLI